MDCDISDEDSLEHLTIDDLRDSLMRCNDRDPKRPHLLRRLADALDTLFQGAGFNDTKLVDESLDSRKAALFLTPLDDPQIHLYKYDLANSLYEHFQTTQLTENLQLSISLLREVLESQGSSDTLPARFYLLLQFALQNQVLFRLTRRQEDIDASIAAFIEHTEALPDDHRPRKLTRCLWMTATAMLERHGEFPSSDTLNVAIGLFERSSMDPTATPLDCLEACAIWALEAKKHNHFSEIKAYTRAFTLLPQYVWFGYGLRIRQERLNRTIPYMLPTGAADCAIRFGFPEQAVEWLDEGRSVLWGQMLDLRSSHKTLRSRYPDLADRFEAAGRALEDVSATKEVPSRPAITQPRSRLDVSDVSESKKLRIDEWNSALNDIRAIPQFVRYLMPRSYSELKEISRRGPVFIINIGNTPASHALILRSPHDPIVQVLLPGMTSSHASYLKRRLSEVLRLSGRQVRDSRHFKRLKPADDDAVLRLVLAELWTKVAEPILTRLDLMKNNNGSPLPRAWWCPTGALIDLPIHAAGLYSPLRNVCVADFVISSYAPMLSTLLVSDDDLLIDFPRTLAIGQSQAQGASPLPGTIRELELIRGICGPGVTSLEGAEANIACVVTELGSAEIVHFASHGQQVDSGFESALILHDGRLHLSELIRQRVPLGRLAFLSACETAKSSYESPDEVMNIATAMLFAGFKGVVATLWSIDDADGPAVSEAFYKHLFKSQHVDTRNAAIALHIAAKTLRDNNVPLLRWIPFVHLGV